MKTVTVIPVPHGMTPMEAYDEIVSFGELVEYRWWRLRFHYPFRKWAVIEETS